MKNNSYMNKKIFVFALFLFAIYTSIYAQSKRTVVVEPFTAKGTYISGDIGNIRNGVMAELAKTQRVNVIDGSVSNMPDGDYVIIKGLVCEPVVTKKTGRDEKNKYFTMYETKVDYIVSVFNPESKKVEVSFRFRNSGFSDKDQKEAISSACQYSAPSMKKFIEAAFEVKGKIVQIDEVDDREAKYVYINLGSENGIKKGQKFDVFMMVNVGGDLVPRDIADLTAKEVLGKKTLCSVNKGGDRVLNVMNSNTELLIKTRAKRTLFGQVGDIMGVTSGSIPTSGIPVDSPYSESDLQNSSSVLSNNNSSTVQTANGTSSQNLDYYDFVKSKNGVKYVVPTLDWSYKKADIIQYMSTTGYKNESGSLSFSSPDDDDEHHSTIMYMIMNGKYFSASVTLGNVNREEALSWLKAHYVFKSSNNEDILDMHNFKTKDGSTDVTASFMTFNESEKSTLTIMYRKNLSR